MTRNIPDDADEIPSLAALPNDRERRFVKFMIQSGGNKTLSAMMAGYSPNNRDAAAVTGFNLAKRPRIAAAITDLCRVVLGSDGIAAATAAYLEIARDPTHKDRAKAVSKLVDLAFPPTQRVEVEHNDWRQKQAEKIEFAKQVSLERGIPIENILGPNHISRDFDGHVKHFDERWGHESEAERFERLATIAIQLNVTAVKRGEWHLILGHITQEQEKRFQQIQADPRHELCKLARLTAVDVEPVDPDNPHGF
jgi:phage terminase small subunit